MANKIYDIIPPQQEVAKEEKAVEVKIKRVEKPAIKRAEPPFAEEPHFAPRKTELRGAKKKSFGKKVAFVFCVMLILGGIVYGAGLASNVKVGVKVWPKMDDVSVKKAVLSDSKASIIDYEKSVLPGQVFTKESIESQEFPATGKAVKEIKAKGVIKIYNNYSEAEQSLVSGTRFVSSDGKLFKLINKITVPGSRYDKSKLVAGEIDAEVEAAEPGDTYNIPASTFSIPGFAGTPKYTSFYAKSFSAMSGGFKGETTVVTQDDLNKAESAIVESAKSAGLETFRKEMPAGYILVSEGVLQDVKGKTISLKAGDPADKFKAEATISTSSVIVKSSDAEEYAKSIIGENTSDKNKLKDGSLKITLAFKDNKFLGEGDKRALYGATYEFSAEAKSYQEMDLNNLKSSLLGKSFKDIRTYMADNPEAIYKIEISPGLFWRKSVPNDGNKVNLDMIL